MKRPARPARESARLEQLDRLAILDTEAEPDFDQIVRWAAGIAEAPIALLSLVDDDRQWFKARLGMEPTELSRAVSFCGHAILSADPFIIGDTLEDERFADNPLVVDEPYIRFYAGFPLTVHSARVGTLCVLDQTPRELSERQLRLLAALAEQAEIQLEWRGRLLREPRTPPPPPGIANEAALPSVPIQATLAVSAQLLDVIAIVDPGGTVRYESPSMKDVFGYDPSQQVGHSAFEHVHPEDRAGLLGEFQGVLGEPGGVARARYRYRHENGSWRVVESVARNLIEDPAVRGVLIQTRDMTPWADAERMLEESRNEALELAKAREQLLAELRALQKSRQQLSSLIVHDLKSPLAAIVMSAHFALETADDDEDAVETARGILDAAHMMERIVNDLLDVSRSESGELVPNVKPVDLAALVHRTCGLAASILRDRKQSLVCDVAALADPEIAIDAGLIERVVRNLVDNASKYSPRGSEIRVRLSESGDGVRVDVADRGPGIPDSFKERVFDLYTRVDREMVKHARASHGLGLAFCRLAVEAHGGRIWVEDRDQGGSRFSFELARA